MSRLLVLVVMTAFALLAFAPTVEATHQWGHRYMIFGRILDSEGEPAQQMQIRITVETTLQNDPLLPTTTDCSGLYYSYNPNLGAQQQQQLGMEAGVMHIHAADLPRNAEFTIMSDYGNESGDTRERMHRHMTNIQLDQQVPPSASCEGEERDWTRTFVVNGRVQRDMGNEREDIMTVPQADLFNEVEVTIETEEGVRNMTVETNQFGDYFAIFENVTVSAGAEVTTTWQDETREQTLSQSEMEYRVTELNVIVGSSLGGTAVKVLLYVVGGAIVVGAAAFGIAKVRENMETKRVRETSGRKRANR